MYAKAIKDEGQFRFNFSYCSSFSSTLISSFLLGGKMLNDVAASMALTFTPKISSNVKSEKLASKSKDAAPRVKAKEDNTELR